MKKVTAAEMEDGRQTERKDEKKTGGVQKLGGNTWRRFPEVKYSTDEIQAGEAGNTRGKWEFNATRLGFRASNVNN